MGMLRELLMTAKDLLDVSDENFGDVWSGGFSARNSPHAKFKVFTWNMCPNLESFSLTGYLPHLWQGLQY